MKAAPVQALSAAVAVGLVFPFQCRAALRTDWKSSKTVFCAVNADLLDRHRHTEMLFWLVCGTYEQIVWRNAETGTNLFERYNGRGCPASDNGAEISGAEITSFGSPFIA